MKIPNDIGHPWRLNKFVEYQHLAPAIDPITYCAYAQEKRLNPDDCILLAWYHSLTYCEITAAFLLENHRDAIFDPATFWAKYKPVLIFGSARRYARNMDWFVPLMEQFKANTQGMTQLEWLVHIINPVSNAFGRFRRIEERLSKWKFMGRFSVDLFMEAIVSLSNIGLIPLAIKSPLEYDWRKTSNLTSGLLNIFYFDNLADLFDKTGALQEPEFLDCRLKEVINAVQEKYPHRVVDTMSVVNKICSFRNLFKKARYGGFHHDRQLGNLIQYQTSLPGNPLWELMFQIRATRFPLHMLGEFGGWNGIRPERKKLWVEKGLTGVEKDS